MCVGWYHSHPGFGCWLSMTDVTTQKSFEALASRAVAVVIDPIQSVRGRVVMDAFRSIHMNNVAYNTEPRISTGNTYYTKSRPSREARLRGLNKIYYNMVINATSTDECEVSMLRKLKLERWTKSLLPLEDDHKERKVWDDFTKDEDSTCAQLKQLASLTKLFKS
jgi:26S proteasome regulatory subunit N11